MAYRFKNIETEKEYLFIHIPKTGGSSLESKLKESELYTDKDFSFGGHETQMDIFRKYFNEPGQVFWSWLEIEKFTFVRNPWSWYVSNYHYVMQNHVSFDEMTNKMTVKDKDYQMEAPYMNTFSNWLRFVYENTGNLIYDNNGSNTRKYQQMVEWAGPGVEMIKIEDAHNSEYLKKLGLNFTRRVNTSKHNHYVDYYDDDVLVQIVAAMHGGDIETFNYKFGD